MRWFRTRWLLSTVLASVGLHSRTGVSAASVDNAENLNPLGLTFDYKIGWVDVEASTFGASIDTHALSTYNDAQEWSLLLRYDERAKTNITQISEGWGLGIYDQSTWILIPGPKPLKDPLYIVGHSSGKMDLEDTVVRLAVPTLFMLMPQSLPSTESKGYELIKDSDFTLNSDVNLAENPKAPYGPWNGLVDTNAEGVRRIQDLVPSKSSVADSTLIVSPTPARDSPEPSSTETEESQSRAEESKSGDASNRPKPSATPSKDKGESSKDHGRGGGKAALETVLPAPKYIKGDPNYDVEVDPLGTMFVAPHTGLYVFCSIFGVGFIAHVIGTVRRLNFKRQFRNQTKNGPSGLVI